MRVNFLFGYVPNSKSTFSLKLKLLSKKFCQLCPPPYKDNRQYAKSVITSPNNCAT